MEVTLLVVTLLSIALAIAMGILTWRLLQEERLRSEARVAALEQGLAETMQDAYVTQQAAAKAAPASLPRSDPFTRDDTDWLAEFSASTTEAAAADPIDDVMSDTVVNANGGLFGQFEANDDRGGWSRRALIAAPWAAVVIGAVIAFWTIGQLMTPAADRTGTVVARAGAGDGADASHAANAAAATALELMSLRQEMQDGRLTISGMVRNPRGGVPQERLTAVVFFFDGAGGFLSSTRAPLDYRALAPGQESPFQLSAPAPVGVARYRVSFRRDEGAVVPHIDRRQQVQQSLQTPSDQQSDATRLARPEQGGFSQQQEERRS